MRKFNHQNIIHLYGVYETENSVYVILEYLEGRQLYNRLKNVIITLFRMK
jgi:serine/threonine protein kinase